MLKVIKLAAQSVAVRVVVIMSESMDSFLVVRVHWFHLQDKVAARNISVLRVKDTTATLK